MYVCGGVGGKALENPPGSLEKFGNFWSRQSHLIPNIWLVDDHMLLTKPSRSLGKYR